MSENEFVLPGEVKDDLSGFVPLGDSVRGIYTTPAPRCTRCGGPVFGWTDDLNDVGGISCSDVRGCGAQWLNENTSR